MNNTNSAGVLAVLDPQAELGVKQSTKNANAGFVDWRDWCAYIGKAAQARAAVAELQAKARLWDVVRRFASGEDFDRWEEMARGGHIASDAGNTYADERAAALAALAGNSQGGEA